MAMCRIKKNSVNLFSCMEVQIKYKRTIGKESTADLYRAASNWLKKFKRYHVLGLSEVTPTLVDDFIRYLQQRGTLKVNTINSYICAFRAMYNVSIRERHYTPRTHPFAHVVIHPEKTIKRAVGMEVFEALSTLNLNNEPDLQKTADLCLFSFMACGIPFVDLVHLTKRNIVGNTLSYHRAKTGSPIRIELTPGMRCLLHKYVSSNNPYLFSLLPPDGVVSHEHYKQLLRNYNRQLKKIGERLNLPTPLTSYVVRHSWATIAYRKYTPVAVISQALGHTSEKTTRHYLAQLDISELTKANRLVTGTVDSIIQLRT